VSRQLWADLIYVDADLRLFDPAACPDQIPPKRPVRHDGWFTNGELPRQVLDALRRADAPLPVRALVEKRVDGYLRRQKGGLVEAVSAGARNVAWRVAGSSGSPTLALTPVA
jgi:hypothetical protein